MCPQNITVESDALQLTIYIDEEGAAYLDQVIPAGSTPRRPVSKYFDTHRAPLVEVRLAGEGTQKHKSSKSLLGSYIGPRLHYKYHDIRADGGCKTLDVTLSSPKDKITVISHLALYNSTPTLRASATIRNDGNESVIITQITSLVLGGLTTGSEKWWDGYTLSVATNSWFREAQWVQHSLPAIGLDDYGVYGRPENHFASLAHYAISNRGTFSTEGHLPMGLLERCDRGETWLWQVESNGSWRWEIGDWRDGGYLAASGPIESDHDWRQILEPGGEFKTVPVALVHVFDDYESAFGALTTYRRLIRRVHDDNKHLPIIFNDYMNCLMGDPTEGKILALVDPVVKAGAEYFVIDCGWYADDAGWWDDVGEWEPSKKRFPSGFRNLLSKIRAKGLIPGLWIEPEVIGVRSAVATQLPNEAFFQRNGHRVVEKGRYQLDYRHPTVRDRMHSIIQRLVTQYGVGYFKFDYNIDVVQGTDIATSSPGSGQLEHNRAYLSWVNELFDRYPNLVIENCSSGAQRMDYAMLSTHPLQSTSDQQDPDKYAAISAALPSAVTPEQGAVWVYPQAEWDDEVNAFTVVNALLARVHLSGRLDLLSEAQFAIIREGMDVYRAIRADLPSAMPFWPLGLPGWHDDWVALGMKVKRGERVYVAVWRRGGGHGIGLPVSGLRGCDVRAELLYPKAFAAGTECEWDAVEGVLKVKVPATLCARLFCLTVL
ncbi:putative Melibiase subfamily [Aspergillus mulundensis]|uniref:alpha-galactosidase n=1 Tax=Aspergillus mulundensis TaxID=1810919 RepID=A0A3D8R4A6_9EURO|nr:Alpha-1,4-galactosidase [Aspergillus mulundensis]RDW68761.1 Alpha-1,4-galactosidase [Aspergillus mulundensis]